MLNILLFRLRVMLIVAFLVGSSVFYVVLHDFHDAEASQLIQDNVLVTKAMQKYISKVQKPAIFKLIKEKKLPEDYFDPILMSSTFIINMIHDMAHENHFKDDVHIHEDVEYKFASDNPTNPRNKTNAFESEVLKKFNNSNISSYKQRIKHDGKDTLFFAIPVSKNTNDCLKCHGDPKDAPKQMLDMYGDKNGFNEKLGEIRAINAVYSSIDSDNSMMKFFIIVEILMLIIFLTIYLIVRYFVIKLNEKDQFIAKQSKFAAMGEMISMIAHQWRQPLTGISMTANNLLLDIELQDTDEKRLQENLESISTQVGYLSATIDDFKNFFKPNLKSEAVDINKLIDDSCMVIASTIKGNGITINKNYLDGITAMTIKNDLMQIILNLIKNSMDAYIENKIEDRVINITTSQTIDEVIIDIKDNAGGIPKDVIDKIFDPYFSTKDKKVGTGLGLYMSKLIIETHLGGQLLVETQNDSTNFRIVILKKGEK